MKSKDIYVIGDIHGSYIPIDNFYRRNKKLFNENHIMIILGDAGCLYYLDEKDNFFKEKLGKYNLTYFIIRGNHEKRASVCAKNNPTKWHKENFFGNKVYVENAYPYIKYALDEPALYQINEYKTLIIPGAYSVDKYYRLKKGWAWFDDEQLSSEEMDIGRRIVQQNKDSIDLVLSHTCPIMYEPKDLFLTQINQSTVDKTMEMYLGEIEFQLNYKYKLWMWGHFHAYRPYYYNKVLKNLMLYNERAVNLEECINTGLSRTIKTY